MNKNRLVLLGFGLVFCGGMALAYFRLATPFSWSPVISAKPSVAKAAPKPSMHRAPAWQTDGGYVSIPVAPGRDQPQQKSSELATRFQNALTLGDPRGTLDAMTAWADADPAAAGECAGSMRPGPERERLLREVARRWAARNPEAALAWVNQSGAAVERERLVGDICWQVGQTDPWKAISFAERSGLKGDYAPIKGSLAELWATKDPDAAVGWALSQPRGDIRNQFVAQVASVQALTSPEAAAKLVLREIPPGPEQDNAVLAVIDGWGRKDLNAATAWVNQFPSGPLRERAQAALAASQVEQTP